ncbi:hypothetical protein [Bradyrhizobium sp. SRL28]|uniref:hypothetical protein n=1 Tax=Bradyrhizobium sp. SRL28 TaxID=2836178 RepID=UPI00201C8D1E|nr:hypothetical protein [Bradyrhizobium sp. SRL28]
MLDLRHPGRLDDLFHSMEEANECFLGYPFAKGFNYEPLWRFPKLTGNNSGDPFTSATYRVSSRTFEWEVIDFFARLFRARSDEFWGYVTNGGTEGNIYGLYLGRELYPNGVAYFSRDTHFICSGSNTVWYWRQPMFADASAGWWSFAAGALSRDTLGT